MFDLENDIFLPRYFATILARIVRGEGLAYMVDVSEGILTVFKILYRN